MATVHCGISRLQREFHQEKMLCFVVFNYAPISIFLVQSCWINKCFVMNVQILVRLAVIKCNVPIGRAVHRSVMD